MATYWKIAKDDWDEAIFNMEHGRHRSAVFYFQQFAEKGAKTLLEKKDSLHNALKSHRVDTILTAYNQHFAVGDFKDMALYLSSFYFDTRYPGDNYSDVIEIQVVQAYKYAKKLRQYYEAELIRLDKLCSSAKLNTDSLKNLY